MLGWAQREDAAMGDPGVSTPLCSKELRPRFKSMRGGHEPLPDLRICASVCICQAMCLPVSSFTVILACVSVCAVVSCVWLIQALNTVCSVSILCWFL